MENHKYICKLCSFFTNTNFNFNKHNESKKHKINTENNNNTYSNVCTTCNKKYKTPSGFYKHKKKCSSNVVATIDDVKELKESITELKTIIFDMKDKPVQVNNIITNNNNNNQNNNNFNVNLFLNENLTKAKNFIDMINCIQLDTNYNEYISSADYIDSIVRMIKSELDKLPILERPIHCIKNEDENQQIIHIRHNNQWNKETELEWTQQIHNYYIDDDDEPMDENKKIIFYGIKQMEDNIINQIQRLYQHKSKLVATTREYKCEMNHVPNKIQIIKTLIEHINLDRSEILRMINEAYCTTEAEPDVVVENIETVEESIETIEI
jgi:hypothetical protein